MTGAAPAVRRVIVFLADDLGWGDLGSYGAERIPTPHLDALAARGMRFTDCHAASAVCTPSRYGLLTGRYPWRSPLHSGVLGGTDPSIIAPSVPTLAGSLAAAGLRTGAFGKWHLGLDWTSRDGSRRTAFDEGFQPDMQASGRDVDYSVPFRNGPIDLGFDRFFGIAGSLDMPPYCFLEQDRTVGIPSVEKEELVTSQRPGLQVPGWRDNQVDVRIADEACAWIDERLAADEPFFAYVASAAPHRPCVPPEFVRGASRAGARGDAVCLVDWMVGRLLEVLESHAALEDTLFVFTSDNGAPMIFPEDGDVVEHRPNGAWRGQKADAWEGGHRVPLLAAGPGIPTGTSDELVSLLDLFPTIAAMTDAAAPDADGEPIPALAPGAGSVDRVLGQQAFDGALVLREGTAKAILGTGSGGFSEPVGRLVAASSPDGQLYDLSADPAETRNLWPEQPDRAQRMLRRYRDETGFDDTFLPRNALEDDAC